MTTDTLRRFASPRSLATFGLLTSFALSSAGCLDHPVKGVEIRSQQESNVRVSLEVNKDVDILFVIDDSASMGEEQGALAKNFRSFVEVLEDPEVDANFRIGVTTTNMGGHDVTGCTSGEQGRLRLKSCTQRKADFDAPGGQESRFNTACAKSCKLTPKQLQIKPTKVEGNDDSIARAWIEKLDGETNLPKGTSAAEAFQCFGPQGISGCGYEQQLESMYSALRWAAYGEEFKKGFPNPNFGFIRERAILAIINVTDEIDCSLNTSNPLYKDDRKQFLEKVFGKKNAKSPFWVDGMDRPTSAVCLRAGANCENASGGEYESCKAVNYDVDREELGDGNQTDSVLRPISEYISYVDKIEKQKQQINSNQEVIVALIGGVNEDGSVTYRTGQEGTSEEKANFKNFGIGFGCQSQSKFEEEVHPKTGEKEAAGSKLGFAIPPVRMAEFTTHFAQNNEKVMFQICSDDFSEPLKNIAKQIRDQIRPACYTECVKNSDPDSKVLQPKCDVLETTTSGKDGATNKAVEECEREKKSSNGDPKPPYKFKDGQYVIPEDETVCYVLLVDPDGRTKDKNDDMDDDCVRIGQNLQFKVQRKKGARPPAGTAIKAVCELSSNSEIDCPDPKKKD